MGQVNNIACTYTEMFDSDRICQYEIATHLYLQLNGWGF